MSSVRALTKVRFDKDFKLYIEHVHPGEAEPERRVVTKDHHYATNPDTGLPAVFTPGETVPDWALSADDRKKLGLPASVGIE